MKILYLARQPPVQRDNGSRIRTHALASQLTEAAQVRFLLFDTQPASTLRRESEEAVAAVLPRADAVTLVRPEALAKRRMQLETLLGRDSYLFRQHRSRAMYLALAREIETFKPDVLHCDNLLLGEFARLAPPRVVRAIAPENVDSVLLARMADTTDAPARRLLYRREAALLARWERTHLPNFDVCLAVSEEDTRCFAELGAHAVCIPNGVAAHPEPPPVAALRPDEPLKLLFVGGGATSPTASGSHGSSSVFCRTSTARCTPALTVVGSGWEWLEDPRCDAVGHVESLERYYEAHHVALVPLRSGGGSRLKVAEALAKGIPVLGTSVGLEGYPLEPGVHALFADTPEQQCAELRWLDETLRTDTAPVDHLVAAGFHLVEEFFWIASALAWCASTNRRSPASAATAAGLPLALRI